MRSVRRAIAVAFVAAACASCNTDPGPGPELLDEVDVVPEVNIEVDETGFGSDQLTIQVGEAFEVTNTGQEPHTFRIRDRNVDTGDLLPGESAVIVLTTEGSVEATDESAGPDDPPTLTIEVTPATP